MTDNVSLFARDLTETSGDQLMHWAISDTVKYLTAGRYERALVRITGSVLGEQARVAGIRVETP